jgi:hypothetical protein
MPDIVSKLTFITSGALVQGEWVEMSGQIVFSDGTIRNTSCGGYFDGIRASDWAPGEPYAYFREGHMNGIPQGLWGVPAEELCQHLSVTNPAYFKVLRAFEADVAANRERDAKAWAKAEDAHRARRHNMGMDAADLAAVKAHIEKEG